MFPATSLISNDLPKPVGSEFTPPKDTSAVVQEPTFPKLEFGPKPSIPALDMTKLAGLYLHGATNNEAEYEAVFEAISHACQYDTNNFVVFRVDSMVLARQLKGTWACKSLGLIPLYNCCTCWACLLAWRGAWMRVGGVGIPSAWKTSLDCCMHTEPSVCDQPLVYNCRCGSCLI